MVTTRSKQYPLVIDDDTFADSLTDNVPVEEETEPELVLALESSEETVEEEPRLEEGQEEEKEEVEEEARQVEAEQRVEAFLHPLSGLSDEDNDRVQTAFNEKQELNFFLKVRFNLARLSLRQLLPEQRVGGDVISFYFTKILSQRDEEMCRIDPDRKRCHFVDPSFYKLLTNEGHVDPEKDGVCDYSKVKKWCNKKVPGGNIFHLDKIFFPIIMRRGHNVCVVASMQEKRLQFYDSNDSYSQTLGDDGKVYLKNILQYIKEEYEDKNNNQPLPDEKEWVRVVDQSDTPQQKNGTDCGVFTCMFADFISMNCPLDFDQSDVALYRNRMALDIINRGTI